MRPFDWLARPVDPVGGVRGYAPEVAALALLASSGCELVVASELVLGCIHAVRIDRGSLRGNTLWVKCTCAATVVIVALFHNVMFPMLRPFLTSWYGLACALALYRCTVRSLLLVRYLRNAGAGCRLCVGGIDHDHSI